MRTLPIYNQEGKEVEKIKLDPAIFDGKINTAVLHQVVKMYLANRRKGNSSTKTRGDVSGGGRKPWKQKGTGRARISSIRAPHWRGGGVVFGPHPRDFSYSLPQRMKQVALKTSLNLKLEENGILVLDAVKIDQPKTKEVMKILGNFKKQLLSHKPRSKSLMRARQRVLFLSDKIEKELRLAGNNIAFLDLGCVNETNAYDVLKASKVIITKSGLLEMVKRLKK